MKNSPVRIGLIFVLIYLVAHGIYRCNKYDCLNLKKDEDKILKKVKPPKIMGLFKKPEN